VCTTFVCMTMSQFTKTASGFLDKSLTYLTYSDQWSASSVVLVRLVVAESLGQALEPFLGFVTGKLRERDADVRRGGLGGVEPGERQEGESVSRMKPVRLTRRLGRRRSRGGYRIGT
jgi:hypothetical protein